MGGTKAEEATRLLKKAQELLKGTDNKNIKKATEYLKVSVQLIKRS